MSSPVAVCDKPPAKNFVKVKNSVYDYAVYDSSTIEQHFAAVDSGAELRTAVTWDDIKVRAIFKQLTKRQISKNPSP